MATKQRCRWAEKAGPLDQKYHDQEWGVPIHNDRQLFELLILEGAQAGLSWSTILKKRNNYRRAYDNFDVRKIVRYNSAKQRRLLKDPGIIRNRLKIQAALVNAKAFIEVQREFGSFNRYVWGFVGGQPIQNRREQGGLPARTRESDALSKDLKRRGYKFAGSTICYAFLCKPWGWSTITQKIVLDIALC